jgi:hypothetical protein
MALDEGEEQIAEDRRKEIFLALVDAQDHEIGVTQSRKLIASRFGISEGRIRQIEREGLERQWPPLQLTPACRIRTPAWIEIQ